jgi:hypothetical protein
MGLARQRSATRSIASAVASFQKALDVLEDLRIQYVFDGDDRNTDIADELCAELKARIDAEVVAPIVDADYTVVDQETGKGCEVRISQPKMAGSTDSLLLASPVSSRDSGPGDRITSRDLVSRPGRR